MTLTMICSVYLRLCRPRFLYAQRKLSWYLVLATTRKDKSAISRRYPHKDVTGIIIKSILAPVPSECNKADAEVNVRRKISPPVGNCDVLTANVIKDAVQPSIRHARQISKGISVILSVCLYFCSGIGDVMES